MNMTPRAKKLLAGLTAAALTLSMLPATALAAKDYATGGETALRFSNSGITVQEGDYDGYKIDGTELTINAAGTYVLSGSCADGSVTVKKGTTGVVLVLDGLTLTCGDSAAIACNKSTEVTIVAADGTVNTLAAKGSTLTIQDASGNSVYSAAAPCNVNFAFFSSPKLTLGSSYTLTGGSTTTTATAQTGTTTSSQPGGGQRPDGTGSGTGGQRPSAPADGTTPPEKPDGSGDNGASGGNAQQPGPGGFTDVSRDDWFANGVDYVSQKGLMSGTGTGTFAPNTALTRGMLVTILYQMAGAPEVTGTCPFRDVAAGSYYEKAAIWAAENGLVSGYENGCFGPNDPVTREQLAAILYRYA